MTTFSTVRPSATTQPGVLFEVLPGEHSAAPADLAAARKRAYEHWELQGPVPVAAVQDGREARMDQQRAQEAHALERGAIALRAQQSVGRPPGASTVVLGHRHSWLSDRLASVLAGVGVHVACTSERATDIVAALVIDQPDLVLLSDHLHGARGIELLARGLALCPSAAFAVQVENDDDVAQFVGAGASAVYARRLRPPDLALALCRLRPPLAR